MRTLALLITVCCVSGSENLAVPQDTASAYVREDSWIATMRASRARYRAGVEPLHVDLGPWWVTAPLPAQRFEVVCFPEEAIDLDAVDERGQPLWSQRPEWADGVVHRLPRRNRASTYLFRTMVVADTVSVTGSLGSDDGIALWLNGEERLAHDVARGVGRDQESVELPLVAGENHLLLKIHNNTGDHGFYFALSRKPLRPLWSRLAADFPGETAWMTRDLPRDEHLVWFEEGDAGNASRRMVDRVLSDLGATSGVLRDLRERLVQSTSGRVEEEGGEIGWLDLYVRAASLRDELAELDRIDLPAFARALEDLTASFPSFRADRDALKSGLAEMEARLPNLRRDAVVGDAAGLAEARQAIRRFVTFHRETLLRNPLLDFEQLLAVQRPATTPELGLPQNWQGNCSLPRKGYDDRLVTLSPRDGAATLEEFYAPPSRRMIADVDLHFDADRLLFSMPDEQERWQIWELSTADRSVRRVTNSDHEDIDNYDACYLPDGRILFDSTRVYQGIPCVGGKDKVANLFLLDEAVKSIRQLCFDQDHDWCPTVLNDGRVLYTRWEYSDTPHYFTRLLFHMNPDGTGQAAYYGSNSFWPNSMFYARPIPDHPSQVVAIVSGHHGVRRMGELVVFDPARGRFEADGVVQRIPGFGKKVEPIIEDKLVDRSWPRFLHPYPLSEKYFLVSCQPTAEDGWGIYLVDVFDNLVKLAEVPGSALFEPIPLRSSRTPPVIPDRVDLARDDATVYLADVYTGPGLAGVPRGEVEKLRVFEFHYAYPNMGGHKHVAVEGGWDVHRILGTVPVETDGSAAFQVPANTPIAIQPLDKEGKALQLMRSWFTAMPGEVLSCVGCHEDPNTTPISRPSLAAQKAPRSIERWYGPPRGFSFEREVQPVLDRHCVVCHDGQPREEGTVLPDLRRRDEAGWNGFTPSYLALHPYVRRPGPESDYHLLKPLEFHADTSELVQRLTKGHHGVQLEEEDWDRLITWIDLNVPDHGTWAEHGAIPGEHRTRRLEMLTRYANRPADCETIAVPQPAARVIEPRVPSEPAPPPQETIECADWPLADAAAHQRAAGQPLDLTLDLGGDVTMAFALVPAGMFVMGDASGFADELPRARVSIEEPFYLGRTEVTREQWSRFDPTHDNGYLDQHHKDHTTPGYPVNDPDQPVIRVSWEQAVEFCAWLSERTGRPCGLPTEAQWEWAARAGAETPFSYGDLDTDFAAHANLADASMRLLAVTGVNPQPIENPNAYEDFLPKDSRFDDGEKLMAATGRYRPNPWGLYDMHGNVWEWTRSRYVPYPHRVDDGRNDLETPGGKRVVRGGSWNTRPQFARASQRLAYRSYQPVHDVGLRVMVTLERIERTQR